MIPAFALQVAGAVPASPIELITGSTAATKAVLILLGCLSLLSWAIIVLKWWEFRRLAARKRAFEHEFVHVSRFEQARALVRRSAQSPFTRIFTRAAEFLAEMRAGATTGPRGAALAAAGTVPAMPAVGPSSGSSSGTPESPLSGSQVEALRLILDSETASERDRLAGFLPWLATIGSVSPLIGLFGTVLGVISAFIGIATKGSGNIGAVAPGVAEALIATAAALAVAIPAVFAYNIFASRLNRVDGELEGFGTEIIALLVREGQI